MNIFSNFSNPRDRGIWRQWRKPSYNNKRFGFEVTMYVGVRQLDAATSKRLFSWPAWAAAVLMTCTLGLTPLTAVAENQNHEWKFRGGNLENTHHAKDEKKIDAKNINRLKLKWIYKTYDSTYSFIDLILTGAQLKSAASAQTGIPEASIPFPSPEPFAFIDFSKRTGVNTVPAVEKVDGNSVIYFPDAAGYVNAVVDTNNPNGTHDAFTNTSTLPTWTKPHFSVELSQGLETEEVNGLTRPGKMLRSRNTPAISGNIMVLGSDREFPTPSCPREENQFSGFLNFGIDFADPGNPLFFWLTNRIGATIGAEYNSTKEKCVRKGAYVVALDRNTGSLIWRTLVDDHLAAKVTGSPIIHNNVVYVPLSSTEETVVVSNSADIADDTKMSAADIPPYSDYFDNVPTPADFSNPLFGLLYTFGWLHPNNDIEAYRCCTFRGSLVALDLNTGEELWRVYMTPGDVDENGLPVYAGNALWETSMSIDKQRESIYVGTGTNYKVPREQLLCERLRLADEVKDPAKLAQFSQLITEGQFTQNSINNFVNKYTLTTSTYDALAEERDLLLAQVGEGVTCDNLNTTVGNYPNSILSIDISDPHNAIKERIKWAYTDPDLRYDAWVDTCAADTVFASMPLFTLAQAANNKSCPTLTTNFGAFFGNYLSVLDDPLTNPLLGEGEGLLRGPDYGFDSGTMLVKVKQDDDSSSSDSNSASIPDLVIANHKSGITYAVNANTGELVWKTQHASGGFNNTTWDTASDGKRVYVNNSNSVGTDRSLAEGTPDKCTPIVLRPFENPDGSLRAYASYNFDDSAGISRTCHLPPLTNVPNDFNMAGDPKVICNGNDCSTTAGTVTALDVKTGHIIWQRPTDRFYTDKDLLGLSAAELAYRAPSSVSVANDVLFVGGSSANISVAYALNAKTGKLIWNFFGTFPLDLGFGEFDAPYGGFSAPPAIVDGKLFWGEGPTEVTGGGILLFSGVASKFYAFDLCPKGQIATVDKMGCEPDPNANDDSSDESDSSDSSDDSSS